MIRPFFRRVLADVDRFCVQSEESARRLVDLGADAARVTVTGSLKFDSLEPPAPTAHGQPRERVLRFFRSVAEPHRASVAGSTMRGEESAVLGAFARRSRRAMPSALLVLAPRQPGALRARSSASRATPASSPSQRSELPIDAEPRADVVVLDTIGELAQLYQLATAVFVGGSLADHGGHNILEPAVFGKPIVFGPLHAELQGDRRGVPSATTRRSRCRRSASSTTALLALGHRSGAPRARSARAARALVEANRGAQDQDARGDRRAAAAVPTARPGPIGGPSLPPRCIDPAH